MEEEIKIVVHDKGAGACESFRCDVGVIEENMRYFSGVISAQRVKGGPMSISVNCDIEIFRWLIEFIMGRGPEMSSTTVVSLILSSDFLGMSRLRADALQFFARNIFDVVMSDVNLDHITDRMIEEMLSSSSFGELCRHLVQIAAACLGLGVSELQGMKAPSYQVCPNRQFVGRLILKSVSFVTKVCERACHRISRCVSCRRLFDQSRPNECVSSLGAMDGRGFISNNHVGEPGCVCVCDVRLLSEALAGGAGGVFSRALGLLEKKEDSPIRAFFTPQEALTLLFIAFSLQGSRGTLWETRHTLVANDHIAAGDSEFVRIFLSYCLPSRCERVHLHEGRRDSQVALHKEGEGSLSGWNGLESEWILSKHVADITAGDTDPEVRASAPTNLVLGLIDLHERSSMFLQRAGGDMKAGKVSSKLGMRRVKS